jgi:hypothetical protein
MIKKIFLVKQESDDYDMIKNVIVVADTKEKAKQLGIQELQNDIFYNKDNEYPIIVEEIDLTKEQIIESF